MSLRMIAGLLFGLLAAPLPAAWQNVGAVRELHRDGDAATLILHSGAAMSFAFVSPDVVRVRLAPDGRFGRDFSYALSAPAPRTALQVDERGDAVELRSAGAQGARVVVRRQPALSFEVLDANGRPVLASDPQRPPAFDRDTGAVEFTGLRDAFDLYYGFGEQALPTARDHQTITLWNTDAYGYGRGATALYQSIPFFHGSRGGLSWGAFFDNTWRSHFDMGASDPERWRWQANGGELDLYVFTGGAGRSPRRVLGDYTALTGRTPLPPLWALGYQQSRWSYKPQARVVELAREFRERKIPLDVLYLDIDYMDGYRVFTWSPTDFPEPGTMIADLHGAGVRLVEIVDPGIKADPGYAVYDSGRQAGVYVRDAQGAELRAQVWPGETAFPDFTDPQARAWWGGQMAKPVRDDIDGIWNDMNEPGVFVPDGAPGPRTPQNPRKTFPLDARHAGDGIPGDHARYHNVYGMQMARATFEGLRRQRPDRRPLVLTRAGYAGVQRYSAVWTGDNSTSWEHLQISIPMLTGLSISGVPFVGADVGGFSGSPSAELFTRWLQAAALTPFLRGHSAWNTPPREPWVFGAEHERINRAAIELRYRLLPYLYALFHEAEASGAPPMRPLWFDYPRDDKAATVDDEFLVGDALLVAPVVTEGAVKRDVQFPAGADWIDWYDGTRHAGGTQASVAAPLDRLPLFLRAGASVPTQPVVQHTGEMANVPLTVVVALGAAGRSTIYQDAGDGYAYRDGGSRTVTVEQNASGVTFSIPPNHGWQKIGFVEFLGLDAAPKSVRIDGKRVHDAPFDAAARRLRVTLPDEHVGTVTLTR
ncbi:glycoside hydrolase family 31 protein [Tahibacter caeni]|uniref:glycoside hydrolase family 31 protein n=1 Tax=Tahibacter caeni TaxID=1453545 RepID=UPI0021485E10|nr:glycoside hydrolase family 31 protein [Tahibacter caeni]